jgi:hypothetical protein
MIIQDMVTNSLQLNRIWDVDVCGRLEIHNGALETVMLGGVTSCVLQ